MEILTKESLVGTKTTPTAISKTFTPLEKGNHASSVRIHFSHPESDGKSADVGGGGRIRILKRTTNYVFNFCASGFSGWRSGSEGLL